MPNGAKINVDNRHKRNMGTDLFNEHNGNVKPNSTRKDISMPVCVELIFSTCVQSIISLISLIDQSTILLIVELNEIDLLCVEREAP